MGECGCYSVGARYRLQGPSGYIYLIRFLPECDYCATGSGVEIQKMKLWDHRDDIQYIKSIPELPVTYTCDGDPVTLIKAGVSRDELKQAAEKCAWEECDEIVAGVLAEAMPDYLDLDAKVVQPKEAEDE